MLKNASRSNNIQKTILLFLFFLLLVFIAHAQYSLGSSTYVQDFNDLPNSGTQLSVTGDDLNNVNVSLNGWYFSETGSNANTSIGIGAGSSSTGDTYSFGVGDESDRTLGCLQSSSLAPTFGFYFKNNTNAVITSITISYSGETWRIGTAGRSDKLDFQYSLDASSLINGTWTDFDALDYENTSSTVSGGGSLLQSSSVANTLTGISIANGSAFFIRWKDFDATGSDDGVGIDDITISVGFSGSYSNATDYFRSNTLSGNWGTPDSWQSSADGSINWITATVFPTTSAAAITISNGTTITINSNATAKALTIETGGTLKNFSGDTLTIADDAGIDFTVNGTYVLYGTEPIFASGATAVINSGGLVRADGNTGGKSDAFASNASVLFKTGSIFEWAIISGANVFNTSNTTYFNASGNASESPVFKINVNVTVGANGTTTFNGKFEVASGKTITFQNTGTKIFRDGFGGDGTIVHKGGSLVSDNPSGPFKIKGSNATIGDNITLNLENNSLTVNNELEIAQSAIVTISGSPTINIGSATASGSDFVINGTLKHNGSNPVYLTYGSLTVNGYIDASGTGTFTAGTTTSSITNVTIGSTSANNGDNAGTLTFTNGYNYINKWTMKRAVSHTNPSVVLGSDVIVNSLSLSGGIAATGNNLFTYNNIGSLTLPATYSDSYICTCNSSGAEITPTGSSGFRINNVSGNTDQMFPVGTDFVSSNRMALNMNGVANNDYTVVVGKGDIGNTPLPRVNRIWYVSQTYTTGTTATMKLYFTKRDWSFSPFGSAQDEIEDGFLYNDPHLIQKNSVNQFFNNASSTDVIDYSNNSTYPYDVTEIYGLYTKGISPDLNNNKNGIIGFYRFSIVNAASIILPVKLINFKAYQKSSAVRIDWTALNEINVDHYEVEKSVNGISFSMIGSVNVINNNFVNYTKTDPSPLNGNNFYRIKAIDKNGAITYTSIVLVIICNSKTSINIYPNPVQNKIVNIQFKNLPKVRYNFILYSSTGRMVFCKTIKHDGGSAAQNFTLPLNVKPGVYIVKLSNETSDFTSRIVVE